MNFTLDPGDEAFRQEVRQFIRENLPEDIARRGKHDYHSAREDVRRWMRILNARGWAAPHWPEADGGTSWSPIRKFIFQEELRMARAPVLDRCALDLVGPVLCEFGSPEQKKCFLPRILNSDDWWCQGFSEPGAGSDLASLRTRGELVGDRYIVNGHKTWTTEAHYADWIFALVRTENTAKPQAGISFLLIDMKSPGITRRPIWSIDEGLTLNEVFFDDVEVPRENLIGEPGKGWSYAKFLLSNERTSAAVVSHTKRDVMQIKALAAQTTRNGRPLMEDPLFRAELGRLEVDVLALEWSVLRVLYMPENDPAANAVASLLKLRGSELSQRAAELAARALGHLGLAACPDPEGLHNMREDDLMPPLQDDEAIGVTPRAMFRRSMSIYGGSNEIQRNIIAKLALQL